MTCDEMKAVQGAYLDSELDAKTTLEIAVHLRACAECARLFAREQKLEARMRDGLSRGQRTVALWEQIERSVTTAGTSAARPGVPRPQSQPGAWQSLVLTWRQQFLAGWQRSRWAWSGLGAAWAVILILNLTAREAEGQRLAEKQLPRSSEVRLAAKQKRLLMADLAAPAEPAPAAKAKVAPPSPRSDRRKESLNT